ncbi:MAG: hypothetical protein ACRC5M_03885 [Anaeroplasmataceae bacterium]
MISCSIVGGHKAENLKDYINNNAGGSIVVEPSNVYKSFTINESEIKSTYIKVQKLIYLIDESKDILSDLKVLFEAMQNKAFFRVEEIWIFGIDNEINSKGLNYFERLMSDLGFSDYYIRLDEAELSYNSIYKEITGVTEEQGSGVKFTKIYRAHRADKSKVGYDPKPYSKNRLLAMDNSVEDYDKMKEASVLSETNKIIKDVSESQIPKVDLNIDISSVTDSIVNKDIIIVCGNSKAGVSIFASTLAINVSATKTVNIVDISHNCGSARTVIRKSKSCTIVDNKKLLTGTNYSNNKLSVYNTSTIGDKLMKPYYLKYLFSTPNRTQSDYTVIDCNIEEFYEVINSCSSRIHKIFLCCQEIKDELILIKPYIERTLSKGLDCMVYLNNSINYDKSAKRITTVDVKEMYKDIKVISPIDFNKRVDLSQLLAL